MFNRIKKQQLAYKQEAYKLLAEFQSALMALEKNCGNEDLIGRVFRAVHTIMGSGSMFGYDTIAAFAREVEAVYDLVLKGKMTVTMKLIDLSLSAGDAIMAMLEASETDAPVEQEKIESIIIGLKALIPPLALDDKIPADTSVDNHSGIDKAAETTYLIRFRPPLDIYANGTNPVPLLDELTRLGRCHIVAHTDAIPLLHDITPEFCYVFWDIILVTDKGRDTIEDVFIFVSDLCRISIRVIDENIGVDSSPEYKELHKLLVERGDPTVEDISNVLKKEFENTI